MIYVTGDFHGDISRFDDPKLKKLKKGDTLIICGDFGFIWNGGKKENAVLEKLFNKKYNIAFIDGTHENFDLLTQFPTVRWMGAQARHIGGNVYHLLRGQIYTMEGQRVFTFGGGESEDKELRLEGVSWWREEQPTKEELMFAADNLETIDCNPNIVITHEPPASILNFLNLKNPVGVSITPINTFFDELSACCEYDRWFFGSVHMDKNISSHHIAVFKNIYNAVSGEKL